MGIESICIIKAGREERGAGRDDLRDFPAPSPWKGEGWDGVKIYVAIFQYLRENKMNLTYSMFNYMSRANPFAFLIVATNQALAFIFR